MRIIVHACPPSPRNNRSHCNCQARLTFFQQRVRAASPHWVSQHDCTNVHNRHRYVVNVWRAIVRRGEQDAYPELRREYHASNAYWHNYAVWEELIPPYWYYWGPEWERYYRQQRGLDDY